MELPNDDEAMSVLLDTGALGNIRRVQLIKDFNLEETQEVTRVLVIYYNKLLFKLKGCQQDFIKLADVENGIQIPTLLIELHALKK